MTVYSGRCILNDPKLAVRTDLYFAGQISIWHEIRDFTIVPRAANVAMAGIHDRMPALLHSDEPARRFQFG